jgi:hypothetical protein
VGQAMGSMYGFWVRYTFGFFFSMIGLNIMYAMMLALIPDQVPVHQIGVSNGVLAFLLVTGSLFGFGLFHSLFDGQIQTMYRLYACIVIVSTILTGTHAHDKDAELTERRIQKNSGETEEPLEAIMSPPKKGRSKWKRVASKVKKKAREIVITPTIILRSMLIDPCQNMKWKTVLSAYTIDREKYHDFFMVTVSRLFYYCGMSVQTFFLYFLHDVSNAWRLNRLICVMSNEYQL